MLNWTDPDKAVQKEEKQPMYSYSDIVAGDELSQPEQTTTAQAVAAPQQQPVKKSAWDYYNEITSRSTPTPTYDQRRPEDLKRVARNTALAKGFSLIGDMISVQKGAKVKRRPPAKAAIS